MRNDIHAKLVPEKYARSIGVTLAEKVHFNGIKSTMYSIESWLITIGDNVSITENCTFVTHDDGSLILRKQVPYLEWTAPVK